MFEAQSKHRMGLLLWMSHPAWPSFVLQTYDYFFEPTAEGISAQVEILNLDGSVQSQKTAVVDSAEDSVVSALKMECPSGLTPVHFIRLKLMSGAVTISENFYWRGLRENDFRAIRELPKVGLTANTRVEQQEKLWALTTELENVSRHPALMVRVKAVRESSGDRILPAIFSDNYVALMPGERRVVRTEIADADTRGERPRIVIEGFNIGEVSYR